MGMAKAKSRSNKLRRRSSSIRKNSDTPRAVSGCEPEPMDPDARDRLTVHRQLNAPKRRRSKTPPTEEEEKEKEEAPDRESRPCCVKCDEKRKFKPKNDDCDYIYSDDDFKGDEQLKLRFIHHRRMRWITGDFYADCSPEGGIGGIFHRERFARTPNLDYWIRASVNYVIKQYKKTVKNQFLEYEEILNVTVQFFGCWWFYVTFNGYEQYGKCNLQFYQTVVIYFPFRKGKPREIVIFRRKKMGKDEYEDLLPPTDELTSSRTRVKPELMFNLDEEDRQVFWLGKTQEEIHQMNVWCALQASKQRDNKLNPSL